MKIFLIVIFLAGLCSNCKTNSIAPVLGQGAINLILTDMNGNNLLDPSNPDKYTEKDIEMYYLIDGVKKRQYDPKLTLPKQLQISEIDSVWRLMFFADESASHTTTFLQWKKEEIVSEDTIQCEYSKYGNLEKVWVNGVLKNSIGTYRYVIKMIK